MAEVPNELMYDRIERRLELRELAEAQEPFDHKS